MSFPIIPDNEDKLANYRVAKTIAAFMAVFQLDTRVRSEWVDGKQCFSLVDLMGLWGEPKASKRRQIIYSATQMWQDEKKRILKRFPDAKESFFSIPMIDKMGRKQKTEVATLETVINILLELNSPSAREFRHFLGKNVADLAMPESEYRRHFALLNLQNSSTAIPKFLKEVGATYFNGEDTERLD